MKISTLFHNLSLSGVGILSALLLLSNPAAACAQVENSELAEIRRQIEGRRYHEAELRLEEIVERNTADAEAWELLGAARQGRWDFSGAAVAYRKALDLGRENAPLLRGWIESEGRSLSRISLLFKARRLKESAVRALELDPYNVETRGILAAYYYVLPRFLGGDKQKANRLVEELVELSPADGYYLLGARAQDEKKPDPTILEYWETALRYDPQHTATLRSLGLYWIGHDSTVLAVDYYRRAVSSKPDDPWVYLSFGRAYRRVDMDEKSAEQFKTALEIDPFFADARFNLAEYYEKVGDKEAAIRHYQTLALNNPTYRSAEIRKRLRRLIRYGGISLMKMLRK